MPSGAGHDAMKLHEVMPQAMLFVRGLNAGISHNPLESTTADDMQLAVRDATCWTAPLNCNQTNCLRTTEAFDPPISHEHLRQLDAWIDQHFDEQVAFLQQLVRVPTDTPPGNNAPACRTHRRAAASHGL
jgi:acetylornithine deacetylase/succinyl-diaminopimelate desuccinylase-like protein